MHRTDEPPLLARHRPVVSAGLQARAATDDKGNIRLGIHGEDSRIVSKAEGRPERTRLPRVYPERLPTGFWFQMCDRTTGRNLKQLTPQDKIGAVGTVHLPESTFRTAA